MLVSDVGWFAELPDDVGAEDPGRRATRCRRSRRRSSSPPSTRAELGAPRGSTSSASTTSAAVADAYVARARGGGRRRRRRRRGPVAHRRGRGRGRPRRRRRARARGGGRGDRRVNAAVAAVRARAVAVPVWVWLAAIVVVSRGRARRARPPDRRAVDHGRRDRLLGAREVVRGARRSFLVRGVADARLRVRLPGADRAGVAARSRPIADAYAAAKAINAVLMSLAAIPAYFLAPPLVPSGLALVAALLDRARALDALHGHADDRERLLPAVRCSSRSRSSRRSSGRRRLRQVGAARVSRGIAFATRAQAVALVAAVATAPILLGSIERDAACAASEPFAPLYGDPRRRRAARAARHGRARPLAARRCSAPTAPRPRARYTASGVLHFLALPRRRARPLPRRHPVRGAARAVARAARARRRRRAPSPPRRSRSPSGSLAEVAAFASQPSVQRIEERNMFYLAPLRADRAARARRDGVVPRPARRARRRRGRRRRPAGLHPVRPLHHDERGLGHVRAAAVVVGAGPLHPPRPGALGGARRRARGRRCALRARSRGATRSCCRRSSPSTSSLTAVRRSRTAGTGSTTTSVGSLWAGIHVPHPDWIDRARRPRRRRRLPLDRPRAGEHRLGERVLQPQRRTGLRPSTGPSPDALPETPVHRGRRRPARRRGRPDRPRRLRARRRRAERRRQAGRAATRGSGSTLYRVDGPVVILPTHVDGRLPATPGRAGASPTRASTARAAGCRSLLGSDPHLYRTDQVVSAPTAGERSARPRIAPTGQATLDRAAPSRCSGHVPRRASRACVARHGPGRRRPHAQLGAHFLRFDYRR